MDRPIAAGRYRSRETSWLPSVKSLHLPLDKRTTSWALIIFALILALAGEYVLVVRTTKAPATQYQALPATTAPAANTPQVAPVEPAAVAPQIQAAVHAPKARAVAIHVTRVAPIKQQPVTAPAKTTTTSAPVPSQSCNGTVASLTQPVTNLLPGPLGGSSGVVQTVACVLP
ncbi:MAG TPA: hypothetical protein VGW79_07415 [Actinomycetota bacterium]|nr:hypothetical protein [Actinomycetota bacterium]